MDKSVTKGPRVLLYDLETTHNIVAAFELWSRGGNYIPHTNVIQERYIVTASWKWLGEPKVYSVATSDNEKLFKRNPHDDRHVVETLYKVLSEADVIVAHNGDQYDIKFLNARIIANGLSPLPPLKTIDTKKVARSKFMFNSNRLDYLGNFLGVGRKIPTSAGLWLKILTGDDKTRRKAIKEMVKYNKQDVLLLEDVFKKLQPFMPEHINRQLFDPTAVCPRCGSTHVQSRGTHKAVSNEYRRFQCQACGGWFRETQPVKKARLTHRVL